MAPLCSNQIFTKLKMAFQRKKLTKCVAERYLNKKTKQIQFLGKNYTKDAKWW